MSGIRKIKRRKASLNKPKKVDTKITPIDILLIVGLTLFILGLIAGGFTYFHYLAGRPEQVVHSQYKGTYHVTEEPPGDPNRKTVAMACAIAASFGLLLSAVSWIIKSGKIRNLQFPEKRRTRGLMEQD